MLRRLIGISAALSLLVVASAASATSPGLRISPAAHASARQVAPRVRVQPQQQRPAFRATTMRPMSHQAERPRIAERVEASTRAAEQVRPASPRGDFRDLRQPQQCVPGRTCGRPNATPKASRNQDGKQMKKRLADEKKRRTKF